MHVIKEDRYTETSFHENMYQLKIYIKLGSRGGFHDETDVAWEGSPSREPLVGVARTTSHNIEWHHHHQDSSRGRLGNKHAYFSVTSGEAIPVVPIQSQ